ncbi:MAG: hypothetical protein ACYC6Q_11960 [Syntrophales bacterium]
MGKQEILQDHKKTGKTFQPPFTHKLGPLHEISWVKTMIPELFWIAIIQDCYGHQMGVEIITAFSRIVCKCTEGSSDKKRVFASMSSFGRLTPEEGFCVRKELAASGRLFEIQKALNDLIIFYPQCPLCFLYSKILSSVIIRSTNIIKCRMIPNSLWIRTICISPPSIWRKHFPPSIRNSLLASQNLQPTTCCVTGWIIYLKKQKAQEKQPAQNQPETKGFSR